MVFLRSFLNSRSVAASSFYLNLLHTLNDGFEANFPLLLPFLMKDLHISLTQVGFLSSLLYVFGILLALPSGYIALKIGGFKTLIIALCIYAFGFLGISFSGTFVLLVLMFTLGGIGLGLFHPIAFALLARSSVKEKRGTKMGSFSAVGDLGKIGLSTFLTFIVVYIGWRFTSLIYGVGALILALILYSVFLKRNDIFTKKEQPVSSISIWSIVKHPPFMYAALTNVLDNFASQTLFIFLPFLLLYRGFSPFSLALFAGAFFVGNFAGRLLLGRMADAFGNWKAFMITEICMAFCIFLLAHSVGFYFIVVCAIILGIFTKGTNPVVKTMVSEAVEHHGNYEKAYGLNSVTSNSAIAVAPIVLGYISTHFGIVWAFNVMAIVALLAIIPALGFHHTHR